MFAEDLTAFFDTDDFGVAATIKTPAGAVVRTANVILSTPLQEMQLLGEEGASHQLPNVQCQTSDLAGVKKDYIFEIGAAVFRFVRRGEDDGTGISLAWLRKQ